ncbi:MAG: transcription antitermination factor NusB [Paracoccaceae bacterium]
MSDPERTPRGHNLSGNQRRRLRTAARLYAIQALFQMEASDRPAPSVIREFEEYRFGERRDDGEWMEADHDHFARTVGDAVNEQARIDQMTDRALVAKWPIARIDPTLRALFRAAGAELIGDATPPRVAIKEYVDLCADFYEGREPRFVNAVLDHMAREARPEAF